MQRALLLLLGLQCAVLQGQQVSVRHNVVGVVNQEVVLPCAISISEPTIHVSQIMWVKNGTVAVYSPQHGTHVADASRFKLLEPSQQGATLQISPVRAIDEGKYTCEVTFFPDGNRKDTTILEVKAVPQNSAAANSAAVANGEEQTVATCRSANGRPPSRIKWNTNLPGNQSTTMTNNTDGTYTVVSHYMMTPTWQVDGMPITCIITQESVETPIPLKLAVMYPPQVTIEGYDDNWHLKRNDVYLVCNARGNPTTMTYTWKTVDGSPLPPTVRVKDNMLYVNEVDSRVNRSFLCEATNALGSREYRQDVIVREKPNTSGAGATGGIIGGIIAAIVGVAVVATVIMICRQQRRNQTIKDEEEFEGPPAYKPPPPSIKMQIEKPAEEMPLKSGPLPPEATDDLEIEKNGKMPPKYQITPESQHHSAFDDDDYLEKENPIYNEFHLPEHRNPREEQGFVMSPAVYV